MMKSFKSFLFVFIFLFTFSCSNDYLSPDEITDNHGIVLLKTDSYPFTGCCRKFYDNNEIEFEKHYKNGKLDGKFIRYFENGNINNEVNFIEGKPTGYKQYYQNKNLKAEKTDDGKIQNLITWYENGNKNLEQHYTNNILNGKSEQWNDSGQLELSCFYKDNKQDGKFITYHKNGKIKIEGNYVNGNLDGNWKTYNENEQIISEENYNSGKKIGRWRYNFDNGSKKAEIVYKDGLIKENKEWDDKGKLINSFIAE